MHWSNYSALYSTSWILGHLAARCYHTDKADFCNVFGPVCTATVCPPLRNHIIRIKVQSTADKIEKQSSTLIQQEEHFFPTISDSNVI